MDDRLERTAYYARKGDKVISFLAMILILCMMTFGGYSLYDNWLINQAGSSSQLMKYKPKTGDKLSLAQLMDINPDVIGWITIDDSNIDQPITQGKTDMEYVNKDALGEFSLSGSIFLSCLNNRDFSDRYNLTYGHHMESGGMYGDVTEFLDQKFFDEHQTGKLTNMEKEWALNVIAVVDTDAGSSALDVNQFNENGSSITQFIRENATHIRDFPEDSQIMALSTCYDTETNGRVIVFVTMNEILGGEEN